MEIDTEIPGTSLLPPWGFLCALILVTRAVRGGLESWPVPDTFMKSLKKWRLALCT